MFQQQSATTSYLYFVSVFHYVFTQYSDFQSWSEKQKEDWTNEITAQIHLPTFTALPKTERINLDAYSKLLSVLATELHDPLFGFHLGKAIRIADFGILGYLIESSDNLTTALNALLKYDALVANIGEIKLSELDDDMVLTWLPYSPSNEHVILRNMTAWVASVRQLLGQVVTPTRLTLTFSLDTEHKAILSKWFGCEVDINSSHNSLVFPASYLAYRFDKNNPDLHNLLQHESDKQLKQLVHKQQAKSELLHERVCAILAMSDELANCTLLHVAEHLSITPRTLQRHLRVLNTNFKVLLDKERKARFPRLIHQFSLSEVALSLGFNEQSSLSRACRRWFNCSPREFKSKSE
ncbi:AraC family transcriptional regulator [Flocculibacter collagenilyticus]|uniref:AraC family transcriptional regulator n=1 Tax=Flocculibacter collagenilyticus TaxID=2744479 RepID=UPI0018F3D83E|nr:AraC family transcriptional regulator [Flocculibacter collagenilyticus]